MNRRLLWGLAGLLAYVGAALALAMAVSPMFDTGGIPEFVPTGETLGLIGVSILLFAVGGICLRRAADRMSPRATPSRAGSGGGGAVRETDDGDVVVTCGECGTENDGMFTYCSNCAHRL